MEKSKTKENSYDSFSLDQLKKELDRKTKELSKERSINKEEEAATLYKTLFETFENGGNWLTETIKSAQKNLIVQSPLMRVRHLWGYLHHDDAVSGMMDRRGPNSSIQGSASDIGFIAGRELQKLKWNLFEKKGQPLTLKHMNSVHDSHKTVSHIVELPISAYLVEHAMTTEVHRVCREEFGLNFLIDLECDFEMGAHQAKFFGWDGTKDSNENDSAGSNDESGIGLLPIVEKTIKSKKEDLGFKLKNDLLLSCVEHNLNIILEYRTREIKLSKNGKQASEKRLINESNALNLNLIFKKDFDKKLEKNKKTKRGFNG